MSANKVSVSLILIMALTVTACGGHADDTAEVSASESPGPASGPVGVNAESAALPVPVQIPTPVQPPLPVPTRPDEPDQYSELPSQFYSANLDCAYGLPTGPRSAHTVVYDNGTLTITSNNGPSRQATITSFFWKILHANAVSYDTQATGPNVHRLWLGIHHDGQLIGAGLNGDRPEDFVWCGESIEHANIPTFFYRPGGKTSIDWRSASIPLQCEITSQLGASLEHIQVLAWLDTRIDWGASVFWRPAGATIIHGPINRLAQAHPARPVHAKTVLLGQANRYQDTYPNFEYQTFRNRCDGARCEFSYQRPGTSVKSLSVNEATMSLEALSIHEEDSLNSGEQRLFDLSCMPQ